MDTDTKQSARHFLDLIKQSHRGKFKIYIGMSAGVARPTACCRRPTSC